MLRAAACAARARLRRFPAGFSARGEAPLADRSGRSDSLGQTRVLVNGAYVPILSASADWVEFLCPILPATMPLEIAVETPSGRSSFLQTTMQETAPAIFTVDSSQQESGSGDPVEHSRIGRPA